MQEPDLIEEGKAEKIGEGLAGAFISPARAVIIGVDMVADTVEDKGRGQGRQRHRIDTGGAAYPVGVGGGFPLIGRVADHEAGKDEEHRHGVRHVRAELPEQPAGEPLAGHMPAENDERRDETRQVEIERGCAIHRGTFIRELMVKTRTNLARS